MSEKYIYLYGTQSLPFGLSVLEDEIDARLDGVGEVTGAGSGHRGWHIDVEYASTVDDAFVVACLVDVLQSLGVAEDVVFDINGHTKS